MYIRDTIAAVSTPPGNGGIGIVRVSGPLASGIGSALFKPAHSGGLVSHRFSFGTISDPSGALVDEAMAVLMVAPRSYTREDVLELHCHGGMLVVEQVLGLCLRQGARLAEPGEFTRRAFLNGRIDLVQAEAVMDIITSQTEASLAVAQRQRDGLLSQRLGEVRASLATALALVEAYIDFPEEDLGEADMTAIGSGIAAAGATIESLLAAFDQGRVLREGISVLILGKPNAGKSSLLNRLLNENRAIVTHLPGTTRDILEETINLKGLPVRLLDTAGIRQTECVVEQEGINRALDKIPQADLVLFILDASRPFEAEDLLIAEALAGSRVVAVLNKADLPRRLTLPQDLRLPEPHALSAHTGSGVEELKEAVRMLFLGHSVDSRDFVAISRARHRDALSAAQAVLNRLQADLDGPLPLELVAADLREALAAIGTVTGHTTTDELLDLVFSTFCIGK